MTDQTNAQHGTIEGDVDVVFHLDVLGTDQAAVQMVTVGYGAPTIILRADTTLADGKPTIEVTATIPGDLGSDLEGIEVLATIADAFHQAVQGARPALIERLIQPTPPADQVPLDGVDERP